MDTHNRKRLMSAACRYAGSGLALNYYMCYESLSENQEEAVLLRDGESKLAPVLEYVLFGPPEGTDPTQAEEDMISHLDRFREENRNEMEILTSYADCFSIYEYVLNRLERRFVKMDPPAQTPEEFAGEIVDSLGTSDDAMILDERLRAVVAQMPIRYTRQKFYGMVHDRMRVYIGADQEGLESLFYMLETSAMLRRPAGMAETQPELSRLLTELEQADYRGMDAEGFARCLDCFSRGSELVSLKSDARLLLQEMTDDLYALLLSRREAMVDVGEKQAIEKILSGVRALFREGDGRAMEEELTEGLGALEGIQESAMEWLQFSENETDADLRKLEKLLSSSPFVKLEEKKEESRAADQNWIEKRTEEFCRLLETQFGHMSRPVARAVMAAVLSQLPMMFQSVDQLAEYVEGSLLACTDFAEREASMELLNQELSLW